MSTEASDSDETDSFFAERLETPASRVKGRKAGQMKLTQGQLTQLKLSAYKDAATELVCKCMASASDIDAAIGTLSLEQCDVLMKYIYRGCARAQLCGAPRRASPRRPPPPALTALSRRRRAGSASKRRSSLTTLLSSNGTRR